MDITVLEISRVWGMKGHGDEDGRKTPRKWTSGKDLSMGLVPVLITYMHCITHSPVVLMTDTSYTQPLSVSVHQSR